MSTTYEQSSDMLDTGLTLVHLVRLDQIHDDPSWATDLETVEDFRRSIRSGDELPVLKLREMPVGRGQEYYEILDGFHRYRALVAEGVTEHPCQIISCTDEEALNRRVAASLRKPTQTLQARAITALQETFNRLLQAQIPGKLYEGYYDEQGNMMAREREESLEGAAPMEVTLAFWNHAKLTNLEDQWASVITNAVQELAERFHTDESWMWQHVLGLGVLLEPNDYKLDKELATLLAYVRDTEVRTLIIARLNQFFKAYPIPKGNAKSVLAQWRIERVFNYIGCGPQTGKVPWFPTRSGSAMRSLLAASDWRSLTYTAERAESTGKAKQATAEQLQARKAELERYQALLEKRRQQDAVPVVSARDELPDAPVAQGSTLIEAAEEQPEAAEEQPEAAQSEAVPPKPREYTRGPYNKSAPVPWSPPTQTNPSWAEVENAARTLFVLLLRHRKRGNHASKFVISQWCEELMKYMD